jgi:triphosphoribosyl-dephospho-CoA synthetase
VFGLPALLPLLFAGCSVLFVSPYDEVTDRSATELATKTETFLARYAATTQAGKIVKPGKPYDSEAASFYNEARGAAAAMLLRSEQKSKNEEEIQILRDLITRYDQLEASHRLGTITNSSAPGLHRTMRALLQVQLAKKHIGTSKAPASESAANH